MQLAKARSERLIFAPSLSFCPALFVSEALSLYPNQMCQVKSNVYCTHYIMKYNNLPAVISTRKPEKFVHVLRLSCNHVNPPSSCHCL